MRSGRKISRRRVLHIIGGLSTTALFPSIAGASNFPEEYSWTGAALGGAAQIDMYHPDKALAKQLLLDCIAEVERLEKQFSLYRADSSLIQLNNTGRLDAPSHDMVKLLDESTRISQLTMGYFDVSVQPLWQLYAGHFNASLLNGNGPKSGDIENTLNTVGYRHIKLTADRVLLDKTGMALTFNGIAQGYITDRITEMLEQAGLNHVLVNMGEIRALGGNGSAGKPWHIGLQAPVITDKVIRRIDLNNASIATSAPAGYVFDKSGNYHHLFDPTSGRNVAHHASISVIAQSATIADGYSTAFSSMTLGEIHSIVDKTENLAVILIDKNGEITEI